MVERAARISKSTSGVRQHRLTPYVRFARPTTMPLPSGYHHTLTCSALALISSSVSKTSSIPFDSLVSRSRNASSTSTSTSSINPVAPRPHKLALKRSASSFGDARTIGAPDRGRTSLRERTCWESTGNVTPDPCEAVEMSPPMVWSEMDPMLGSARGGLAAARAAWMA